MLHTVHILTSAEDNLDFDPDKIISVNKYNELLPVKEILSYAPVLNELSEYCKKNHHCVWNSYLTGYPIVLILSSLEHYRMEEELKTTVKQ